MYVATAKVLSVVITKSNQKLWNLRQQNHCRPESVGNGEAIQWIRLGQHQVNNQRIELLCISHDTSYQQPMSWTVDSVT